MSHFFAFRLNIDREWMTPCYLHGSLWKNLELFWSRIAIAWQDWVKAALILVQSYSTLNMQIRFAIQKLAQRRKHIGFCRVIIELKGKKCAILIFPQLRLLRKTWIKKNLEVVNYTDTENAPATQKSCFEKYATPTSNESNSFF